MREKLPIPKRPRKLHDRIGRWIAGSFAAAMYWVAQRLSLRGLKRLARVLWFIVWPLAVSVKRKSRKNLELCMGDRPIRERERILKRAVYNFLHGGLLTWHLGAMSAEELRRLVAIRGLEHLDAALSRGCGVIALGAHIGPFSLIGARLAQEGYDYAVVIRISSDPRLETIMVRLREKLGVKAFYRGTQTLSMVRHLKRGGIVHLFLDQHVAANGIVIDFCGVPAPTFAGPAVLARKLNCPVLPIFLLPEQCGEAEYVIDIGEPYELQWTDDEDADILRVTQMFSRTIENVIKQYPEHWIWMHGRVIRASDRPRLVLPELVDKLPERVRRRLERETDASPVAELRTAGEPAD